MTDPFSPSSPSPPVQDQTPEMEKPSRFRLVTFVLVALIGGALVYIDQRTSLDLRLINYRLSPEDLGRQVTYVNISPLSDLTAFAGDAGTTRLETTVYTKIGHKAVKAAGRLDLTLKDANGTVIQTWKDIKLPPNGTDVEWAGFPLGGWQASLSLRRLPATPEAFLEAAYTNPSNKHFTAPLMPIQVSAR